MSKFPRTVLQGDSAEKTASLLQGCLNDLLDLALQLKQAHWNVVGTQFQSVHEQLDVIVAAVRVATDDVAERIITIGVTADGRASTIAEKTRLETYPDGFQNVPTTLSTIADRISTGVNGLRAAIEQLGELDPISEDLLIGVSAGLEKHLWMLQAQELGN